MNNIFSSLSEDTILYNELMMNHTSFKIGGVADVLYLPSSAQNIAKCINICNENKINYYIIGNGTNILVKDKGFRGVIIKVVNLNKVTKNGDNFYIETGANLADLAKYFLDQHYTGFEFASGIPGTFGGAVYMNAGAYGPEIKDMITSVDVLNNGEIINLSNKAMKFGYRSSCIKGTDMVVCGANITLKKGNYQAIKEKIDYLSKERTKKQPLELPSAGSVFKRPRGDFAGRLIESSGLVGYRIGGAAVSDKHAGFIVNTGGATAEDVLNLISYIKSKVKEKFDVELEEELVSIGE